MKAQYEIPNTFNIIWKQDDFKYRICECNNCKSQQRVYIDNKTNKAYNKISCYNMCKNNNHEFTYTTEEEMKQQADKVYDLRCKYIGKILDIGTDEQIDETLICTGVLNDASVVCVDGLSFTPIVFTLKHFENLLKAYEHTSKQ